MLTVDSWYLILVQLWCMLVYPKEVIIIFAVIRPCWLVDHLMLVMAAGKTGVGPEPWSLHPYCGAWTLGRMLEYWCNMWCLTNVWWMMLWIWCTFIVSPCFVYLISYAWCMMSKVYGLFGMLMFVCVCVSWSILSSRFCYSCDNLGIGQSQDSSCWKR